MQGIGGRFASGYDIMSATEKFATDRRAQRTTDHSGVPDSIAYRFMGVGTSEHLVVSREGWFNRRTHVAPQARVQSLRISQGPWQRRLGLADVHVDSPPGPTTVRARHRDAAEARRLFDVEVAMSAWARGRLSAGDR